MKKTRSDGSDLKCLVWAHVNINQSTWASHVREAFQLQEGDYYRRLYDADKPIASSDVARGGRLGKRTDGQWMLNGMAEIIRNAQNLADFNNVFLCWVVENPGTICFALPRWNQDQTLTHLHQLAWDYMAAKNRPISDEELFETLVKAAPLHFFRKGELMQSQWCRFSGEISRNDAKNCT